MIWLLMLLGCGPDKVVGYWSATCNDLYFDFDGENKVSMWEKNGGRWSVFGRGSYLYEDNTIFVTMESGTKLSAEVLKKKEDTMLVNVDLEGERTDNVVWTRCK